MPAVNWTTIAQTIHAQCPIVEECHDYVLDVAKPGVKYMDVHFAVCRRMTERLKELGLMKGDVDEAVKAGAHAMFLPHGLGHMMGMDVHDMEGLGQIYVGFDEETRPNLEQFGTNCLRMGRRLQEGFVLTDEPGIYQEGQFGVRIENTLLIQPYKETAFGRFLQFETLTLCPIDKTPIITALLTPEEIQWLNNYHQRVYEQIAPHLDESERTWLRDATAPLET